MPPEERAARVAELFDSAIECPTAERKAFLEQHCGSDSEIRAEVESLLQAARRADQFMEGAAAGIAGEGESARGAFAAGEIIGEYELISLIGKGGMGEVYLAQDRRVHRRVALKLVRGGLDRETLTRRFAREQQLLAGLNHANIAQLYETGVTPHGIPYFAMEYVEGMRLDQFVAQRLPPPLQKLELFRKICSAVVYAHQHLIVHRDIKPANIRVSAAGEPKLLDFGIAKLLDELAEDAAEQTLTMQRMLTPEYASPEQIRGERISTASDIYSLGVVLYELLTGTKPYRLTSRRPDEVERAITQQEATRPSAACNKTRSLRGDLDNIVLMALRKEPERRYASANALSEDIRRYLEGLPVRARKDTLAYRSSKFVSRNKVPVAATAVVLVAIVAGAFASIWQARIAHEQRNAAQAEKRKAERISQFLSGALSYSNPYASAPGTVNRRDVTINEMLDEVAPRIETELAGEPEVTAALQRTIGEAFGAQSRLGEAERYLRAALATHLRLFGDNHPETALTLTDLGVVFQLKGDYAGAEQVWERALAIYHAHGPGEEAQTWGLIETLAQYGDLKWTQSDYGAAEAAFSEGLDLALHGQGRTRERASDLRAGLGMVRYSQGRLEEASAMMRESVEEGRTSPHLRWRLPSLLGVLGQVLTHQGNFEEALSVLREAEAIARDTTGEHSYPFLRAFYLEAYALALKGDYPNAEKTLDAVEALSLATFPDDDIALANFADTRCIILSRTGRAREGEEFGKRATEGYQKVQTRGAPGITLARIHWAESLAAQEKFDEAEQVLVAAYGDARDAHGADHWRTKQAAAELAKLYTQCGRHEAAARYLAGSR